MKCNKIEVKHFRNIEQAEVKFESGVNILTGANAQGKTNLLEAISYMTLGKSFRTQHDEELIKFGEEFAEVGLNFTDSLRDQELRVRIIAKKRRQFEHNKVKIGKVSEIVGKFRAVLFCPEHLSLIKDGPSERRSFLDVAISQIYPLYLKTLQSYNRVLKQRNQLIKQAEDDPKTFRDTVEFWSEQLAQDAAVIAKYRVEYIERAKREMQLCFADMTGGREQPDMIYVGSSHSEPESYLDIAATAEKYRRLLTQNTERELAAGSTLWGIHKDDVEILINGRSARMYASQGQQRSLALAMKLSEGEVCREICGEVPVFLMDDVFSELDETRRRYLAEQIQNKQVIITSCEPNCISGANVIRVENGCYRKE